VISRINARLLILYILKRRLVDLLHGSTGLLERGNVLGGRGSRDRLLGSVDGQTQSNHSVDSRGEILRGGEGETGSQERSLEEKVGKVSDSLVSLVLGDSLLELLDDRVVGVELHSLLGSHVRGHFTSAFEHLAQEGMLLTGRVSKSLGLHDSLHVGRPTELSGDEDTWGIGDSVGNDDLLDLVAEVLLDSSAKTLVLLDVLLSGLLLLGGLLKLKSLLGDADKLLAIELLELGNGVLVNGVDKEQDLEALLLQDLQERRVLDGLKGFTGKVVDRLLDLGHSGDVVLERGLLVDGLRGVESEELGDLGSVGGVLVDTELEVLGEGLVELVEVLLVLGDLGNEVESLLDKVLSDDLEDLVLLKGLSGDVKGQVLGVDDTDDKVKVLRHHWMSVSSVRRDLKGQLTLLVVLGDEDSSDVELNVVSLLLGLKQVEGRSLGDEDDGLELELTLNGEVLDGQMVLPVVGDRLVERGVLLGGDVGGVSGPDGLLLVELLVLGRGLLDLLGLLGLLARVLILDLLDLGLALLDLLLLLLDLLLGLLGDDQLDGVRDELGVLLDDLSDSLLVKVLFQVVLDEQLHRGSSSEPGALGVLGDGEGSTGGRLPDVLLVVVVLGGDLDLLGNEVRRVETDTELTDHADVGTGGESLHEGLGTGLGDRTEVVDQVGLGHTNTGIPDGKGTLLLVGSDSDVELLLSVELGRVGQSGISDLVEGIGGVGDELSEEDLLVGVESVDDKVEKLRDLGLERLALLSCEGVAQRGKRRGGMEWEVGELTWKPNVSVDIVMGLFY
jgi:hypothetical protein